MYKIYRAEYVIMEIIAAMSLSVAISKNLEFRFACLKLYRSRVVKRAECFVNSALRV